MSSPTPTKQPKRVLGIALAVTLIGLIAGAAAAFALIGPFLALLLGLIALLALWLGLRFKSRG